MIHQYNDDNGDFMLSVSSSVPGLTFIPLGKTLEDSIVTTPTKRDESIAELEAKLEAKRPKVVIPTVEESVSQVTMQMAVLQTQLDTIKASLKLK